jgi:RNA-directed DNA polymerase
LWTGICEALLTGSYEPSPVLRTEISKRSGGKRPLGIPIVLDRVIQQAIARVIGPIFDPFSYHELRLTLGTDGLTDPLYF